ncbi:MAG: hypothetical protein K2N87_05195 [Eubacterium sp.]|nr:hypothetical protein [Eubacterium sp.]
MRSERKAIFIGDRGYCSYNNMAHVIKKGQYFLFRTKDIHSKGLAAGFDYPQEESFDVTVNVTLVRSQEIWAKLTAYNITEALTGCAVIQKKQTKHAYKVNFSRAAHICRKFLYPVQNEKPMDVPALLGRELIPIRNERQYARLKTAHFRKPKYFIYRAA